MPKFLVPHTSGAHRIAAIALYRALLSQCRALDLGPEAQNVVRNRFRQVQHLHSHARLRLSFAAGYEAIDHLDAAIAGDGASKIRLRKLLAHAPAKVKAAPIAAVSTQRKGKIARAGQHNAVDTQPRTSRVSLLDRPLPLEKLSGRRHVPIMVNANHIPVLRLKKPQPEILSQYIDSRIKQRQARHTRRLRLEEELEVARGEDAWDEILKENAGIADNPGTSTKAALKQRNVPWGSKWSHEVGSAIKEVHTVLNEEREKNRIMAQKMQSVIDREQKLFDQERQERKDSRMAEKQKRKATRRLESNEPTRAPNDSTDGASQARWVPPELDDERVA